MPVWTGKYRTPKTLSSSCFMQTSGKGKKGIVLLPHLERPEHNSPSAEELWSRAVHPGAHGMTCAGPEEPSDAPGAQGHWECTRWGSSRDRCHRESYLNTDTGPEQLGTLYSTKPHNGVQSHHPEEEMHFPGERVAKTTHITKTTQCSAGKWETPNWKPEDFTPCFRSCFPTETMIFEGRRYLLEKCSFWMRLIFLWGWFW